MEKNSSQRFIKNFKIATVILCSIIILATIVASVMIIQDSERERKELIARREEERAQIIENNRRMGEAEEGILLVDGKEVDPEKGLTKIDGREVGIGEVLAGEAGTEAETSTTDTSNWDLSKVTVVTDEEGKVVPVPKGFVASGVEGEKLVRTGFVIYEGEEAVNGLENEEIGVYSTDTNSAWQASCTRNQFVWVPVEDPSRIYEEIGTTGKKKAKLWDFTATGRTAISNADTDTRREPGVLSSASYDNELRFNRNKMQGYTKEKLLRELEDEYNNTIESIKKYGGFYIGRYETGNIGTETPVVKRMNTDIGSQTWYAMYPRMKKISSNGNIQIGMIWGSLWDETLQWFIDTDALYKEENGEVVRTTQAAIASDSTTWGNYKNATFDYTTTSGVTGTKAQNSSTRIPTGSTERNKANNIYDMAGNVLDWTLEGRGSSDRYFRGGNYCNNGIYGPGRYGNGPYYSDDGVGFRAYFIIK